MSPPALTPAATIGAWTRCRRTPCRPPTRRSRPLPPQVSAQRRADRRRPRRRRRPGGLRAGGTAAGWTFGPVLAAGSAAPPRSIGCRKRGRERRRQHADVAGPGPSASAAPGGRCPPAGPSTTSRPVTSSGATSATSPRPCRASTATRSSPSWRTSSGAGDNYPQLSQKPAFVQVPQLFLNDALKPLTPSSTATSRSSGSRSTRSSSTSTS